MVKSDFDDWIYFKICSDLKYHIWYAYFPILQCQYIYIYIYYIQYRYIYLLYFIGFKNDNLLSGKLFPPLG